jgi:hypothetical protein
LISYKIRYHDRHVRAVPSEGLDGAPFTGPGIDLRGTDADAVIEASRPMIAWLEVREPGVVVRSISMKLSPPRALVSLAATPRPRALRFDGLFAEELRDVGRAVETLLDDACRRTLRRRGAS